jgi:hypothetical protein
MVYEKIIYRPKTKGTFNKMLKPNFIKKANGNLIFEVPEKCQTC